MTGAVHAQGCGVDLVGVAPFAAQLAEPGSAFPTVFTDREWAHCLGLDAPARASGAPGGSGAVGAPSRAGGPGAVSAPSLGPRAAESLAARWAAKEAAIKAWSALIAPEPPVLDPATLDWSDIEVVPDRFGRPFLRFHRRTASALVDLEGRLGARLDWALSLSHDGGFAIAVCHVLALAPIDEGGAGGSQCPASRPQSPAGGGSAAPHPTDPRIESR